MAHERLKEIVESKTISTLTVPSSSHRHGTCRFIMKVGERGHGEEGVLCHNEGRVSESLGRVGVRVLGVGVSRSERFEGRTLTSIKGPATK